MIQLVDLEAAKDRLHVTTNDQDADIDAMISQASAILLRRIKMTETAAGEAWGSPVIVPDDLQAVVLEMICEMHLNREASTADVLSARVLMLLESWRQPTVA